MAFQLEFSLLINLVVVSFTISRENCILSLFLVARLAVLIQMQLRKLDQAYKYTYSYSKY